MDKLILIDGNSLLNRAFYATPVFSTASGQPTNAIFGFVKLLFKIFSDEKPKYVIVTFDLKAPTFRHKMFDGYKATRSPMPEELASQVQPLKSLLSAMNIAMCEKEGLEADDLIGTLSRKFPVHSYVYTGDRDSFQLVVDNVDVYYTKRGVSDLLKLSADNFVDEIGLKPSAIVDLKALMGDKSDNIPGVFGIGEKSARDLLAAYGTLDGVYENLDGIKSASMRQKLREHRDEAYLSYELATIKCDCDIDIELENCTVPQKYSGEVKELFKQFEFKSLLALDVFDGESKIEESVEYPENEVINGDKLGDLISANDEFFIDVGDSCAKIYCGGRQYTVEYAASANLLSGYSFDDFASEISKLLQINDKKVILYDVKSFLHACAFDGDPACDIEDLSVMKYLTDYIDTSANMSELCAANGYNVQFSAYAMKLLYEKYAAALKKDGTEELYYSIERPLIFVLYDMEKTGVLVDGNVIDELAVKYADKIYELEHEVYEMCGTKFNINSPSQLGEVLFDKLGLKSGKKNKNGKYSTNAEILEKLAEDSPVVRKILSYRHYKKLFSTYVDGFRPYVSRGGVVHTTFNQTLTTTGRLSSANPNLQNIPVRDEDGREIRKIFIPRKGNVLIDADYSQIELRLLAHFSGCKELIAAYEADEDVHAVTASQVFGVPQNEVTAQMRRDAKAVNFGIIYGISDFGLAKNLNIAVGKAKEYIEKYFARYSDVKKYMDSNVEFARKNGYVSTLTGRKRYIREISSANYNLRQFGERAAMNMPLQGSSADIIKIAMVKLCERLKKEGMKTKLILQVHDELILDAPIDESEKAKQILKEEMENAVKLKVPLKVEASLGKNWYEAK